MPEGRPNLRRLVGRVRDTVAAMLGWRRPVEPRSPTWYCQIDLDIQQACRNDRDREEVLYLRQRRISRARTTDDAFSEELALALIEWDCDLREPAQARLSRALHSGVLSSAASDVAGIILDRIAASAHAENLTNVVDALYDEAVAIASEHHKTSLATRLSRFAWLHENTGKLERARSIARDGLELLGWSTRSADPYRERPAQIGELGHHERDVLVNLATYLATCDAYELAFPEARRLLDDLAFALGSEITLVQELRIVAVEGWIDLREGRYAAAERRLGHAWDQLVDVNMSESSVVAPILIHLGQSYLELGLVDEASGAAKKAIDLKGIEHATQRRNLGVARCLRAECVLRRGDAEHASKIAEVVLADATNPLVRARALWILAEAARIKEDAAAAELARQSVAAIHQVLGEDLALVDPLLTHAAVAGADHAEVLLRRAIALPMPPDHPHRVRVLVALADHLDAHGRTREAAGLREQAKTITTARLP